MPAFRCSRCDINWPLTEEFQPCEGCGIRVATDYMQQAMDADDARSLVRAIQFERYWREWDVARFREQLEAL